MGADLSNLRLDDNEAITRTDQFTQLGLIFDTTGKDNVEIGRRVGGLRKMIRCLNGIFLILRNKQVKIVKHTILSLKVLFCTGQKYPQATVENWKLQRWTSLGISRRDRICNVEIRRRMGQKLKQISSYGMVTFKEQEI